MNGVSTAFRRVGRGLTPTTVVTRNCHVRGGHVEFHRNVGMLFQRQTYSIKLNMCRSCVHKKFWEYTFKNRLLGWWGFTPRIHVPWNRHPGGSK